jgi:hypothetical protein
LARISIIDMLGESSMNSGALVTSPMRRASLFQSSSLMRARAHVVQRHPRLGREQPHRDLVAAHLEREDDRGQLVLDRGAAGDVESLASDLRPPAWPQHDHLRGIAAL